MSVFQLSKENRYHVIWEIYYTIEEIGNKELLYHLWIDGGTSERVSSYTEMMCGLDDNTFFTDFLIQDVQRLGFGSLLITELKSLRFELENYGKKMANNNLWIDDKILKDPEWDKVVVQAQKVRKLWREDKEAKNYVDYKY